MFVYYHVTLSFAGEDQAYIGQMAGSPLVEGCLVRVRIPVIVNGHSVRS